MAKSFVYIPVASDLSLGDATGGLPSDYFRALDALGGERHGPEALDSPLPLLFFVATGGAERRILRLREERSMIFPTEPALLIAHPDGNALAAALETLARICQDGGRGRVLYLESPTDAKGLRDVAAAAHDLEARRSLESARVGLVGEPSEWLVASTPEPSVVRNVWGPEVVRVGMRDLVRAFDQARGTPSDVLLESFLADAAAILEPSRDELRDAVSVYLALKDVVEQHRLAALTLACFDLIEHLGTTGCLALSRLADEGIVAGCEGDVVSTVGMLWVKNLLDETPWMANPARVDVAQDRLLVAHCAVPLRMVASYRLRSHFESGRGAAIQGELPLGPVTIFRIGGASMDLLWIAEGETQTFCHSEAACRTQAEIRLTSGGTVQDLTRNPLGNHLVLLHGRHADRLRTWWETMIAS